MRFSTSVSYRVCTPRECTTRKQAPALSATRSQDGFSRLLAYIAHRRDRNERAELKLLPDFCKLQNRPFGNSVINVVDNYADCRELSYLMDNDLDRNR